MVALTESEGVKTLGTINYDVFYIPPDRGRLQHWTISAKTLVHLAIMGCYAYRRNQFISPRISFALNTKIVHPLEVMEGVIYTIDIHSDFISLSQVEGFVRQILDKLYMRGIY